MLCFLLYHFFIYCSNKQPIIIQDIYERGLETEQKKSARKIEAVKRKHQSELDAALDDCKKIAVDKDKTIKVVLMQNSLVIVHVFLI